MPWAGADGVLAYPQKVDDQSMLRLDELLEENAYDECVLPSHHVGHC